MICSRCGNAIQPQWTVCPNCQTPLTPVANPYLAPTNTGQKQRKSTSKKHADATGGVIPYNNPKALIAYYMGIMSGLPLIGLPIGVVAFILGILGLRDRKRNPVIKGSAHAWVGIGCGGFFSLLWLIMAVGFVIVLMNPR